MPPRNFLNDESAQNTIILSDDKGDDDGSWCKSTQNTIVLSDNNIVNMITTHQFSYKPPKPPREPTICVVLCVGFPPGQTPNNAYLFAMYDANELQWDVEVWQNVLYLHAWDCSGVSEDDKGVCRVCRKLPDDMKLEGILKQITNGTMSSTPHQYWSWGVLCSNLLQVHKHLESKELLLFNTYVKLG